MAPRVLFIHNDPNATEALLGPAFSDCGFDVDTFTVVPPEAVDTPAIEVRFPDPLDYDVVVPLGARWSVYDDVLRRAWMDAEAALLRQAADAGIGLLGVCFGGQLLAHTFGGTVSRAPISEIGWHHISTDDPDLVPTGPWFEWHIDRWTLPPGATEIARTPAASQAFVLGRTMALQFHPELDMGLLNLWLADDHSGEAARAGRTPEELRTRTTELAAGAETRIRKLVRGFLARVAHAPAANVR
jgi:GMP synthase-like glutamine amidotransferase